MTITSGAVNDSEFLLSGVAFPLTLAFAPQSSGTASGTLSFISKASNGPTSALSSIGGATSHRVVLTWTGSSSGIAGYNIYRSGGPSPPLIPLDATTTYSDTAVVAGQTYYYVVTAVSTSGVESAYSSQVSAIVPSP